MRIDKCTHISNKKKYFTVEDGYYRSFQEIIYIISNESGMDSKCIRLVHLQKKSQQKKKKTKPQQEAVFSALHLLNNLQDFAEKLFHKLERSKDKFEVRLMMMSLISRLIGLHQVREGAGEGRGQDCLNIV